MFKNARISTLVGFLAVGGALCGLLVGGLAILQGERAGRAVVRVANVELDLLIDFQDLYANGLQAGQATRNILLADGNDPAGSKNLADAQHHFQAAMTHALATAPQVMEDRLRSVQELWTKDCLLRQRVVDLAHRDRQQAIDVLRSQETPVWRQARALLLELLKEQHSRVENVREEALGGIRQGHWAFLAILAASWVAAAWLARVVARRATRSIAALMDQTRRLCAAVSVGALGARAEPALVTPEFRPVIEGMNAAVDAFVTPLRTIGRSVDRISKGDLPARLTEHCAGEFQIIQDSLNRCIDAVNLLVQDASSLAEAAVTGKLSTRAEASRHQGEFRKVVEGVNAALDAFLAPVLGARSALERLADRDLTAIMDGEYQGDHASMKEALNSASLALHDAMARVVDSVGQVSSAAAQISGSSQAVASGASQQASTLEETQASLESMSARTRKATDQAQAASQLASETKCSAEEGASAMNQLTEAMDRIRRSAESTSAIVKDISEIAFQTNLLALNAAVEAARAGEAGRGFAVVAEEVRSLALRAKEASVRTEELIQQSVLHAGEGAAVAKRTNGKLVTIVASTEKVSSIVTELASSAREQASWIGQLNKAVDELGKVTQQNAASSEESSSAAEELAAQSESLAALVGRFKVAAPSSVPGGRERTARC